MRTPSSTSTSGHATRRAVGIALCWLFAAGVVFGPAGRAALARDGRDLEYKVKAGYLFNFAKVVEWPEGALPASESPFVIGVLDDGEALPIVRTLLQGRDLNGHPVQVRAVAPGSAVKDVHMLFVTHAATASLEEILATVNGAPTLLVGETEGFAKRGGVINFVIVDDSVKFEANNAAAGRASLKLGSQLLKLAILVEDAGPSRKN
jgi:hypothetical protein